MYLYCIKTIVFDRITHKYLIVGHTENEPYNICSYSYIVRGNTELSHEVQNQTVSGKQRSLGRHIEL